jgi:hypothetical protein
MVTEPMDEFTYRYFYLIWALTFLVLWAILFALRKDLREPMLVMSAPSAFLGFLQEKTNMKDWWHPVTFIQGRQLRGDGAVSFEDVLIGFAIAGVAASLYPVLTRRRPAPYPAAHSVDSWFLMSLGPFLFLVCYFLLAMGSFYSFIPAIGVPLAWILYWRADLWVNSLVSGLATLGVGVAVYGILHLVRPSFIHDFWLLPPVWYSKLVLGIPAAEYLWFFMCGSYTGPVYCYVKRVRYVAA